VSQWLSLFGKQPALLKGATPPAEKQEIVRGLHNGSIQFVVGTHALLQPSVKFRHLGMIVIDEQHKFGVNQRMVMQEKDAAADFLLMSATPIPQTLARTLYGDLDVVSIRILPKGRMEVGTHLVGAGKRQDMEQFIIKEIAERGTRVYYVAPRIEPDEEDDEATVKNVKSTFHELTRSAFAQVSCGFIHGRLQPEQRDKVMLDFVAGAVKVLVTTTVIEVGVDVPSANIMVIENAERFGLAQLHQLRGRVGRGQAQAYCFLLPAAADSNDTSAERLRYFCTHHDGFEIAEMDLKLRGPGDVVGRRQSGWNDLRLADILRDADLFRDIQEELDSFLVR
jgi:ATP-dependent DNA helicase RecG